MRLYARFLMSAAAVAILGSGAMAADYDPPIFVEQAPEYVPVEVGSGWYLRGDISYNANKVYKDFDETVGLYDSFSENDNAFGGSIGIGYHLNDYVRGDLTFGYLAGNSASASYDNVDETYHATLSNHGFYGMVNAYVDLGTFAGFTPYVGGGIGLYQSNRAAEATRVNTTDTSRNLEFVDNARQYSFAWSAGAGMAYKVTKNASIDLGYQYFAAPNAEYAHGVSPDTYEVSKGLDFHQVKLGLRYDLW